MKPPKKKEEHQLLVELGLELRYQVLGIVCHGEKIASGGTKSRIKTSWSAAAQFEIIPPPGKPPETSTTSVLTFDRSIPTTPFFPYFAVAVARLLLVEIQGLSILPATWLIGDTSAPGERAVKPEAGSSPSARPR
jgi:hypothetical protein